jgi:protein SCO1
MKTLHQIIALLASTGLLAGADNQPELPKPPCCREPLAPAKYSDRSVFILDYRWTSDLGVEMKLDLLRGRPVVLALFFTQCEHSCPLVVKDMKELEAMLPREVREKTDFVLVTIDPEHDTTGALKAYRDKQKLRADRWLLLRGDQKAVDALAEHIGFKYVRGSANQFGHSLLITVLNPSGEVVHQQAGTGVERRGAAKAIQDLTVAPRRIREKE